MIKYFLIGSVLGLLIFTGTNALRAEKLPKNIVVVELFTSQSCSSCPPADKVLSELAQKPNIIALGCHVTYWDHLHWKDTLSQEFCTKRQRQYASYSNSRRVYTPQMIVNGTSEFVGSQKRQVLKEITKARNDMPVLPIKLVLKDPDVVTVSLPALPENEHYGFWVIGYKKDHSQNIPSGENKGRSIHYTNAVLSLESFDAGNKNFEFSAPDHQEINGLAIIAQQNNHGPIIAAGKIEF